MTIKVLVSDDHQLFRQGIVNMLLESHDIKVIGQAENGADCLIKAEELKPDIILMDIGMPIMNGMEATMALHRKDPAIKVIVLSMHADKHYIKGMLEAGAWGYLFKDCTYDQLIESIKTVHAGRRYLSNRITEALIEDYLGRDGKNEDIYGILSEREFSIFKLIAEGKSSAEIADELFISTKTVNTHKQNLLDKLNLKSNADIIKMAIKRGIVSI
jgi:two-component system, NarL family, response regulator NreC